MPRVATIAGVVLALLTLGVFLLPGGVTGERPIRLVVWGAPFEDMLFRDVYARGYEAESGVAVEYQRHADVATKYAAWFSIGRGAEVMRMRITDYHAFVRRGMLEPLNGYIDDPETGLSPGQLAAFPPGIMESLTIDGVLYALPEDTAQFGLYYNRGIFDAYNAANPGDPVEYPQPDWTWDDLRDAAQRLDDEAAGVRGFDMFVWAWPFMQFYLGAGGEMFGADGREPLLDGPEAREALAFLGELIFDGSWDPTLGISGGTTPDAAFKAGRTALLLTGSWWAPSIDKDAPGLDYAIQTPPVHTTDRAVAGSVLWAISSRAERKGEAWRMLRWLVQSEQTGDYWNMLRVAPPADLAFVNSAAFEEASGIADGAGGYLVQPMERDAFEDKAAWIRRLLTPDPDTGRERATIPTGPFQDVLENEMSELFAGFVSEAGSLRRGVAAGSLSREEARRSLAGWVDGALQTAAERVRAAVQRAD